MHPSCSSLASSGRFWAAGMQWLWGLGIWAEGGRVGDRRPIEESQSQ